jgi:hypothetical protein
MSSPVITFENFRSKERIRDLGEVFTPEQYVQKMLDMLDDRVWSDESAIFFEPSCGQGNFVLPILEKRFLSLKRKYERNGTEKPVLSAVANALNGLWAIDICSRNIDLTRKRTWEFVLTKLEIAPARGYTTKQRDFLAHALCAISMQIHVNETLSSVSDESKALTKAAKTNLGANWIRRNKHKPIDFSMSWCEFFVASEKTGAIPLMFQRALKFIEASSQTEKIRGFDEFNFAKHSLKSFFHKSSNHPTLRAA